MDEESKTPTIGHDDDTIDHDDVGDPSVVNHGEVLVETAIAERVQIEEYWCESPRYREAGRRLESWIQDQHEQWGKQMAEKSIRSHLPDLLPQCA